MRKALITALLVVGLVVALATPAVAGDHKVTGTLTLGFTDNPARSSGVSFPGAGGSCTGSDISDGFSDISDGAVVKVRNEKDKTIAVGAIGAGKSNRYDECVFKFSVKVPDASLYTFEVGRRGQLAYSKKKLAGARYKVQLVLNTTA